MRRTRRSTALLLALLAIPAIGCDDAPTAPDALVVAAETGHALRIAAQLPTLPRLVERVLAVDGASGDGAIAARTPDTRSDLQQARSLWIDAEATGPGREGAALREAAYGLASPALAAALGPDALLAVRDTLARWVRLADAAFGELGLEGVSAAIAEGRARLDDARARLDEGDDVAAADAILRAADRLRETTPGAVAGRLIREGERALLRATPGAGSAGSPAADSLAIAHRRADRLLRKAREALADGDDVRAIRRAFYAGQLLGIR